MRPAAWDAWVAKARSVRIEDECSRRGIVFNGQAGKTERCGPCPKCGGDDRFAVNTKKQVFNCRGCSARGDVIAFVQFLDHSDFARAVEALTGEPPPKRVAKLTKRVAKLTRRRCCRVSVSQRRWHARLHRRARRASKCRWVLRYKGRQAEEDVPPKTSRP